MSFSKKFLLVGFAFLLATFAGLNAAQIKAQKALFTAAQNSDLAGITAALQAGANVNAADSNKLTPLLYACRNGRADVITALLQAGANPTIIGPEAETPLWDVCGYALNGGDLTALQALLKAPNTAAFINLKTQGMTPLMMVTGKGLQSAAALLISAGADQTLKDDHGHTLSWYENQAATNPASQIFSNTNEQPVQSDLPQFPTSQKALFLVVTRGNWPTINRVLAAGNSNINGIDTTNNNMTPLMYACQSGQSGEVITGLLQAGADPTLMAADGTTALWLACQACMPFNELSGLNALLAAPNVASFINTPNPQQNNMTVLMLANQNGQKDVISALLAAGADATLTDSKGNTASWYATQQSTTTPGAEFATSSVMPAALVRQGPGEPISNVPFRGGPASIITTQQSLNNTNRAVSQSPSIQYQSIQVTNMPVTKVAPQINTKTKAKAPTINQSQKVKFVQLKK